MRKFTLALLFSAMVLFVQAQMIRVATSPSMIASQIPGFAEVSTIATKLFSYTPSVPPTEPTPADGDSTTEINKAYHYADVLPVSVSISDGNVSSTSVGKVWTLRISIPNALNVGFVFNQFSLSPTAKMYTYNEAKTRIR